MSIRCYVDKFGTRLPVGNDRTYMVFTATILQF